MKETGTSNAPYCPYQEGIHQMPHAPAYYGDQYVPKPTNSAAKKVNHAEVMRQVNEGK